MTFTEKKIEELRKLVVGNDIESGIFNQWEEQIENWLRKTIADLAEREQEK